MTHRLTALAALALLFAAPVSAVRAQDHNHGDAVDCESHDMGRTRCHVSWHDARLERQLSDTQCVRGENWGIDHKGLWVNRGCSGRFVAAHGHDHADNRYDQGYNHGDNHYAHGGNDGWQPGPDWNSSFNVGCESKDFKYRFCAVDLGGAGRVSIARQVSSSACIEGRNWGSNRGGVWVSDGCAAEFQIDRRWR